MGVRGPGSPCNDCSRHETDCPFNNLCNPNPKCRKWSAYAQRTTYEEVKAEFALKRAKAREKADGKARCSHRARKVSWCNLKKRFCDSPNEYETCDDYEGG